MKAIVLNALISLQLVLCTNTVSQHISKTGDVPGAPIDSGPGVPSPSGGTGASDIPTFVNIVDDDLAEDPNAMPLHETADATHDAAAASGESGAGIGDLEAGVDPGPGLGLGPDPDAGLGAGTGVGLDDDMLYGTGLLGDLESALSSSAEGGGVDIVESLSDDDNSTELIGFNGTDLLLFNGTDVEAVNIGGEDTSAPGPTPPTAHPTPAPTPPCHGGRVWYLCARGLEPSCATPYPPSLTTEASTSTGDSTVADAGTVADVDADADEIALAALPECKQRCQCPPGKVWDAHAHAAASGAGQAEGGICKARIDCPVVSLSSSTDDDASGVAQGILHATGGSLFLGVEQGETAILLCFIAAFAAIAVLRRVVRAARARAGPGLPFMQQHRQYGTAGSKHSYKVPASADQQAMSCHVRESPGVPSWPPVVRTGAGSQFDADSGDDDAND